LLSMIMPRYLNFETSSICLLFKNMLILVRLFLVIRIDVDFCSLNLILFLNGQFVIFCRSEFVKFSASRMVFHFHMLGYG
jgi:hypothetical protein